MSNPPPPPRAMDGAPATSAPSAVDDPLAAELNLVVLKHLEERVDPRLLQELKLALRVNEKKPTFLPGGIQKYGHVNGQFLRAICERLIELADDKYPNNCPPTRSILGAGRFNVLRREEDLKTVKWRLDHLVAATNSSFLIPPPVPTYDWRSLSVVDVFRSRKYVSGHVASRALQFNNMYQRMTRVSRVLGHLASIYCLCFDRTCTRLFTGADDGLVKSWEVCSSRLLCVFRGFEQEVADVMCNYDNSLLAGGSDDTTIRVWCLKTTAPVAVLTGHTGRISSIEFSPWAEGEKRFLASTALDGNLCIWSHTGNKFNSEPIVFRERARSGAQQLCLSFSPGGTLLVTGSAEHLIRVYAFSHLSGHVTKVTELSGHLDKVDSIEFSHRGDRFVSGSKDGSARIWSYCWKSQQWMVKCLDVGSCSSSSGPAASSGQRGSTAGQGSQQNASVVQAGSCGGKVRVLMVAWDCQDSAVFTSASDFSIRVWDSHSGHHLAILSGHTDEAYVIQAHPRDQNILVSGSHDGHIIIWDTVKACILNKVFNQVDGQGFASIYDCKWSNDGLMLVATDSHGHVIMMGHGDSRNSWYSQVPVQQFFHTDYRPLLRDDFGNVLDEQTHKAPHLMAPPFLVNAEGSPYPPEVQRLVPGRENLDDPLQIPVTNRTPEEGLLGVVSGVSALDCMIERLASEQLANGVLTSQRSSGGISPGSTSAQEAPLVVSQLSLISSTYNLWKHRSFVPVTSPNYEEDNLKRRRDLHKADLSMWRRRKKKTRVPFRSLPGGRFAGSVVPPTVARIVQVEQWEESCQSSADEDLRDDKGPVEFCEEDDSEDELFMGSADNRNEDSTADGSEAGEGDGLLWNIEGVLRDSSESSHSYEGMYGSDDPEFIVSPEGDRKRSSRHRKLNKRRHREEAASSRAPPKRPRLKNDLLLGSQPTSGADAKHYRRRPTKKIPVSKPRRTRSSGAESSDPDEDTAADLSEPDYATKKKREVKRPTMNSNNDVDEDILEQEVDVDVDVSAKPKSIKSDQRPPSHPVEPCSYSDWITAIAPRKTPYCPQVGDEVYYFKQGHEAYVKRVQLLGIYPGSIPHSSVPALPPQLYRQNVIGRVSEITYRSVLTNVPPDALEPEDAEDGPPRFVISLCTVRLDLLVESGGSPSGVSIRVTWHDLQHIADFIILSSVVEVAVSRGWKPNDRFKVPLEGQWWFGTIKQVILSRQNEPPVLWNSLAVHWDTNEDENICVWDIEPIRSTDLYLTLAQRVLGVDQTEDEINQPFYRSLPGEWGSVDEEAACSRIHACILQLMSLPIAEQFSAPVDLSLYPDYPHHVPFPTDLSSIALRVQYRWYRRLASLLWEVRLVHHNAAQFNLPTAPIVRNSRIISALLCHIIRNESCTDVKAVLKLCQEDEEKFLQFLNSPISVESGWRDAVQGLLNELIQSPYSAHVRESIMGESTASIASGGGAKPSSDQLNLKTIQTRKLPQYTSPYQFAADVRSVFEASKTCNTSKRSKTKAMTVRLSALFEERFSKLLDNYLRETRHNDNINYDGVSRFPKTRKRQALGSPVHKKSVRPSVDLHPKNESEQPTIAAPLSPVLQQKSVSALVQEKNLGIEASSSKHAEELPYGHNQSAIQKTAASTSRIPCEDTRSTGRRAAAAAVVSYKLLQEDVWSSSDEDGPHPGQARPRAYKPTRKPSKSSTTTSQASQSSGKSSGSSRRVAAAAPVPSSQHSSRSSARLVGTRRVDYSKMQRDHFDSDEDFSWLR